jgi:hypothetical protein
VVKTLSFTALLGNLSSGGMSAIPTFEATATEEAIIAGSGIYGDARTPLDAEIQEHQEFEAVRRELSRPAVTGILHTAPRAQASGAARALAMSKESLRTMVGWSASSAMPLYLYQNGVADVMAGLHQCQTTWGDLRGRPFRFSRDTLAKFTRDRADLGTLSSMAILKAGGDRAEVEKYVFESDVVRNSYATALALEVSCDESVVAAVFVLTASVTDGSRASTDFEARKCQHLSTLEACTSEGLQFVPLVVEACGGGGGPIALKTWRSLGEAISARTGEGSSVESQRLLQTLGIALQRENARAVLRRLD